MQLSDKWNSRFMKQAEDVASYSKDTNRHVGAVIVNDDKIVVCMGYNGFPRKVDDTIKSRYERPDKYLFTEHAERNALYHSARLGVSVKGCTIYVTSFPCADCARGIIQSGITGVVTREPDFNHETWGKSWSAAREMFKEANVNVFVILPSHDTN